MCFRDEPRSFGPDPTGIVAFVAMTICVRRPAIAFPQISSEIVPLYASAVSMKLPPAPRKRSETRRPERPSVRMRMSRSYSRGRGDWRDGPPFAISSPMPRAIDPTTLPKHFDAAAAEARWDAEWERSGIHRWDPARGDG